MKEYRPLILSFLLMLGLMGCNLPLGQPGQDPVTPSLNLVTPTWIPLTLDMLKNAEYQAQNGMTLVNLMDGKYEIGSGADFLSVSMLDQVAFGDLNSDGNLDAAIILVENYGGTGRFEYLVPVLNHSGAALPSSGISLGDRVMINSMNIADGRITLDMVVHAPNDPLCCPSQPMTQAFEFYWGPGLLLVHATSGIASGGFREIVIETPGKGDEVSNQIQLKGSVSISPFENTLGVRVLDANNTQIYQGSISVLAPEMGAAGTFDVLLDLSGSSASPGMLRVEITDISMADGSILAMDSVDVKLK